MVDDFVYSALIKMPDLPGIMWFANSGPRSMANGFLLAVCIMKIHNCTRSCSPGQSASLENQKDMHHFSKLRGLNGNTDFSYQVPKCSVPASFLEGTLISSSDITHLHFPKLFFSLLFFTKIKCLQIDLSVSRQIQTKKS